MSKIKTYITATEANVYYPQDDQYTVAQRALFLEDSFGLVNSYLQAEIKVPAVAPWDGEAGSVDAPRLLKVLQADFYRWLLIKSNHSSSPELDDLYDSIKEKCEAIQQNELFVPEIQTTANEPGWNITEKNNAGNIGDIFVRGSAPALRTFLKITITTGGYPSAIAYDYYTSEQAAALGSIAARDSYHWQYVDAELGLEVRFTGQWTAADTIYIDGVPTSDVDTVTPSNTIQQKSVSYV